MTIRMTVVAALHVFAMTCFAQSIDWLPRIPLMQTGWQTPGEAVVAEDSIRNRLMTVGWRIGTVYRTEDNGASWQGQYALGTDVVGKYGTIYVAPDGRYLWHGLTPWNQRVALVSSDGGETWRGYTRDTMVYKDGLYRGLLWIIPPYNIRAYENISTGALVMSSDLGNTWRRVQYPPADSIPLSEPREMIAAPNMIYRTGNPYMYRFDASKDTVWTQTRVGGRGSFVKEVGGGVVTVASGALYVYQSWSDSSCRIVRTWTDDVTGDTVALSIGSVQLLDDSTVYAYDDRGWIFEIRPHSGHIRCIRPFGRAFPLVSGVGNGRAKYIWSGVYGNASMSIVDVNGLGWCVAELQNGAVARVDTVASRDADVIQNGLYPLTYLGDRGVFMFLVSTGGFREVVRSTDLGASWIHTSKVEGDELEPTFIGVRSTVRASDGTLLMHTTRDHCVIPDVRGSIERSFRLTDLLSVLFQTDRTLLFDRASTLYRDGDRVLLTGRTLGEYDYKLGKTVNVVLPRVSRFVRRLTSSMLAAGADSLWMTFDDGREWAYVSQTLTSPVEQPRGQFSDATRTTSGVLLAAVRGVDYKDTNERRGIVRYGGIARSIDNGDTWQWVTNLPDSMRFVTRVQRVNDSIVLAIAGRMLIDSALLRSDNKFQSEVDASTILISTDDGATWSVASRDIRTGMPRGNHEPEICVLENGVVLASLHSGFAFMSTTSGRSWSVIDLPELGLGSVHGFTRETNGDVIISTSVGAGYLRLPGVTSVDGDNDNGARRTAVAFVANGQLHVDVAAPQSRVRIISVDGRCVSEQVRDQGRAVVDLTTFARGMYVVEIHSTSGSQQATVVW